MAKRRTTVFFSDRQIALLSAEATKLDMTVAELLRRIIDAHYKGK